MKKEDSYSSSSSELSESDISSAEEDEEFIFYAILMIANTRGENVPREILTDYVERVVPGYSRQQFKEHFR